MTDTTTNMNVRESEEMTVVNDASRSHSRNPSTVPEEKARTEEKQVPKTDEPEVVIVDWDDANDPMNPKNWSDWKKWRSTVIVSLFTLISPVSSSMIAPATGQMAEEFGITNDILIAMTTSIFVLAYAFGPLFLGPMSEIFGRSRVLQLANIFYLVWNFACGWAENKEQLIAFRFLSGLGGSAPLAIGAGTLGDMFNPDQRGKAVAIFSLAPLLGPALGPVCGGWIAEKTTWRWVFWSTSAVTVAIQFAGLFYIRETFAPVLLEQKANRLRKADAEASNDTEKGVPNRTYRTIYETKGVDRHWKSIFAKSLVRPFAMFVKEPIIQLFGLYMAFVYGLMYLFITTIPGIFQGIYGERVGIASLHYIALGIGITGASQTNARLIDRIYVYLKKRNNGVGEPEFRLPSMVPGTIMTPIGLFLAGWAAEKHVHWVVVDIGIALIGAGMILNFQSMQIYIIDSFTLYAASALAAAACLRSLAGFAFPLFAPDMYKALGYGKGDSILAAVAIVIGCPAPWLFWKYGKRIRNRSTYMDGQLQTKS